MRPGGGGPGGVRALQVWGDGGVSWGRVGRDTRQTRAVRQIVGEGGGMGSALSRPGARSAGPRQWGGREVLG